VFSKTLALVSSARTRLKRDFDPGMVRRLKSAAGHDMTVGGADLAGQAIKAGLVDELRPTSGTAPSQRDHLAGCRRPIAANGGAQDGVRGLCFSLMGRWALSPASVQNFTGLSLGSRSRRVA
jgi:hypothetical protein